jgi:hypothetical protein
MCYGKLSVAVEDEAGCIHIRFAGAVIVNSWHARGWTPDSHENESLTEWAAPVVMDFLPFADIRP